MRVMMRQADRAPGQETKEFPPYTRIDGAHDAGLLVICDHASNALPHAYGTLGLPQSQLERHIGYDIGAAGVTREIARLLGAPALLANFSRLLIDSNRGEDDPTLIMRISDGAVVPGNAKCDEAERERRITTYYEPYHRAIDEVIDEGIAALEAKILLLGESASSEDHDHDDDDDDHDRDHLHDNEDSAAKG